MKPRVRGGGKTIRQSNGLKRQPLGMVLDITPEWDDDDDVDTNME